jgi:predicted NAD-dependent protein-ADP-ribosyltransferase YbiA (DUF1768 family)
MYLIYDWGIMKNVDEVIDFCRAGRRIKYIFFWSHKKQEGSVSKTCLSQWYDSEFTYNDETYLTAEHYMMIEKARLFHDYGKAKEILDADNPGKARGFKF